MPPIPRVEVARKRVRFDLVQPLRLAMWNDLTLEEGVRAIASTVGEEANSRAVRYMSPANMVLNAKSARVERTIAGSDDQVEGLIDQKSKRR